MRRITYQRNLRMSSSVRFWIHDQELHQEDSRWAARRGDLKLLMKRKLHIWRDKIVQTPNLLLRNDRASIGSNAHRLVTGYDLNATRAQKLCCSIASCFFLPEGATERKIYALIIEKMRSDETFYAAPRSKNVWFIPNLQSLDLTTRNQLRIKLNHLKIC